MANPTTEHGHPAAAQAHSPGVGRQGEHPKAPPVKRPDPVLFDDIDPVLLVRLYPEEINTSGAKTKAIAQGIATMKAGEELEASRDAPPVAPPVESTPTTARHQPGR
jgi:hypothetical protein